ncbi:MAG: hypothetical protein RLZ45_2919 [Verrucomicrobiota bacterium]|jgi:hypothetical protein
MHNLRPGPASQRLASQRVRLMTASFQMTREPPNRLPLCLGSRRPANMRTPGTYAASGLEYDRNSPIPLKVDVCNCLDGRGDPGGEPQGCVFFDRRVKMAQLDRLGVPWGDPSVGGWDKRIAFGRGPPRIGSWSTAGGVHGVGPGVGSSGLWGLWGLPSSRVWPLWHRIWSPWRRCRPPREASIQHPSALDGVGCG